MMDNHELQGKRFMKNKKLPLILISPALVVAVLWVGIILLSGFSLAAFRSITVEDLAGRKIKVPIQIDRIVCTGPGALRLIVYLQATDKVIGVEDAERRWGSSGRPYAIAHPELKDLPSIGPGGPGKLPDTEALVKLSPDVIFMTYVEKRFADNIQKKTNIPVVVLSYGEVAQLDKPLFESLKLAGRLLGKEERAEKVVSFIKQVIKDLRTRTDNIPDEEKPTVYIGGVGYRGTHGIDSTEASFPPFVFLQARNVVDRIGKKGHLFIDREKLIEWNPDMIFIDEGGLELVKQDYKKRRNFYCSLKAFKSGDIYGILPFNFYTTNIGTALADAYYIGKVIYPERFKEIDPEKKADEIYKFLVGKPVYGKMRKDFGGFGRIKFEEIKKSSN